MTDQDIAADQRSADLAPIHHEIHTPASPERAFSVFTAGFASWWPPEHTIAPGPVARPVIEPAVGGHCYDQCLDGTRCTWGQVLEWDPPRRLVLAWQVTPTWGYEPDVAQASRVTVTFTPERGGTRVILEHTELQRHRGADAAYGNGLDAGWGGSMALFRAASGRPAGTTAITDQYMHDRLAVTRSYTLVLLHKTAERAEDGALPVIFEHGRRNFALRAEGLLPVVCPVTDDSGWAGIGIFAASVEEVTRIMDDDPGVKAGLFSFEVHPVRGFPGSSLP